MKKIKVGLTGGIGSGKSTVCKIFKIQGITIIDTDEISRRVMKAKSFAWALIKELFGNKILNNNNEINRSTLAEIVFNHPDQRILLEEIVHPFILNILLKEISAAKSNIVVCEVPLLVESGMAELFDSVLTVYAPLDVKINRVTARDGLTVRNVKERIDSQTTDKKRFEISNCYINTNCTLTELETQVVDLVSWWNVHYKIDKKLGDPI